MIKKQGVTFVISFDAVAHCTFQFISFSSCFQYSPLTEYWYFYDLWVEEDILNVIGGKTFSKKGPILFSDLSINSTILVAFLAPAVGNDPKWVLCHHASTHGWAVSIFHSRRDGKRDTVTIIRNGPYVFGGYTDIPWDGNFNIPGSVLCLRDNNTNK